MVRCFTNGLIERDLVGLNEVDRLLSDSVLINEHVLPANRHSIVRRGLQLVHLLAQEVVGQPRKSTNIKVTQPPFISVLVAGIEEGVLKNIVSNAKFLGDPWA